MVIRARVKVRRNVIARTGRQITDGLDTGVSQVARTVAAEGRRLTSRRGPPASRRGEHPVTWTRALPDAHTAWRVRQGHWQAGLRQGTPISQIGVRLSGPLRRPWMGEAARRGSANMADRVAAAIRRSIR